MKKQKVNFAKSLFMLTAFALSLCLLVNPVFAAAGEGTATIGGGASQTVEISSSTAFTVVLTVGASGIATDADSPTFTVPTGFTAPHAAGGASVPTNAGEVDVDGEWFAVGAGGTCAVTMGSSSASGQIITVDVTGACASTDTITLTYKGSAPSSALAATDFDIKTDDVSGGDAVTSIGTAPTVVVKGTAVFADHAITSLATNNTLVAKSYIGGTDIILSGFKITTAGEGVSITNIRVTVTLGTMVIGELTNLRIVPDDGSGGGTANDGSIQAGELAAALATIASPSAGNNDFSVTETINTDTSKNYFIVGTLANTISDGDTLDTEATGANSTISGATSTVTITATGSSSNDTRTVTSPRRMIIIAPIVEETEEEMDEETTVEDEVDTEEEPTEETEPETSVDDTEDTAEDTSSGQQNQNQNQEQHQEQERVQSQEYNAEVHDMPLMQRLAGRMLLRVDRGGAIGYVNPADLKVYDVTFDNAMSLFEDLAIGISEIDHDKIVMDSGVASAFGKLHAGKLFLRVEKGGAITYVDNEGLGHVVTWNNLMSLFESLSLGINETNFDKIPFGAL